MNGLAFYFYCILFFKKKMEIILEKHVRRGKHLLIMLCDFFKNSNIESCFSMAISAYLPTIKYPNECSVITE